MKISPREMTLCIVTLAAGLFGATWYGLDGKVEKYKSQKNEMARLQQNIVRHKMTQSMQKEWYTELAQLQMQLHVFPLDQQSVSPQLTRTIKTAALQYGLDIQSTKPVGDEEKIGDLYELDINCSWAGTISALVDFLAELQTQGLRYDVSSLNIAPEGKDSDKLKGNMVISCAYLRKAVKQDS